MVTHDYYLNMIPGGPPPVINVSQYDDDFEIKFHLVAVKRGIIPPYPTPVANDTTFTVPLDTTAEIRGTKRDGNGYSATALMTINTTQLYAKVSGDQQLTAIAGENLFEITLYKSSKEISSANFILNVEKAPLDKDSITSESVVRELIDVIDDANNIIAAAQQVEDAVAEVAGAALTTDMKEALLACLKNVAWSSANGQEAYDALEEALYAAESYSTVLYTDGTFIINEKGSKRDINIVEHGAVVAEYSPLNNVNPYVFTIDGSGNTDAPWESYRADITAVEIGSIIVPTDMKGWFINLENCTDFALDGLNCSKLTSMRQCFRNCTSLESIDLSAFSTTRDDTFWDMNGMFYDCSSLESADLSMFNAGCVTTVTNIFRGCSAITEITLPKLTGLTSFYSPFYGCSNLEEIDLSNVKPVSLDSISDAFRDCAKLKVIDITIFTDVSGAVSSYGTFRGCTALTTIYAPAVFDLSNVTNSGGMFLGCTNLVGGAGTTYNSSYTDKTYARIDGGQSSPGYFTAKS